MEKELKPEHSAEARSERTSIHRWHAVAIRTSSTACAASQACQARRYLSSEAPRLPLAGCDAAHCDCKYVHFPDRRGSRRRSGDTKAQSARVAVNP
jgi:hypothetical protein